MSVVKRAIKRLSTSNKPIPPATPVIVPMITREQGDKILAEAYLDPTGKKLDDAMDQWMNSRGYKPFIRQM